MDSPVITQVFRRLFSHQTCSRIRSYSSLPFRVANAPYRKSYQTGGKSINDGDRQESHWQQRTDILPQDKSRDFERYPMVTASALRGRRERPKRVKMLARDFIEGINPALIAKEHTDRQSR